MRAVAFAAAALALALSACAPATDSSQASGSSRPGAANVDVDTPELRDLKDDAGIAACAAGDDSQVEDGLPNVTLPCLGGGPDVNLATLRGPMVVNLWAVWCTPCRKELPILQKFQEKHGDRVPMLGIDYNDTQPEQALRHPPLSQCGHVRGSGSRHVVRVIVKIVRVFVQRLGNFVFRSIVNVARVLVRHDYDSLPVAMYQLSQRAQRSAARRSLMIHQQL